MFKLVYFSAEKQAELELSFHTECGSADCATVDIFKNCTIECNTNGVVMIRDANKNFLFTGIVPVIYK